jgi:lipoprotein NlpD
MLSKLKVVVSCAILGCSTLALVGCMDTGNVVDSHLFDQHGNYIVQPGDSIYSIAWRYGLDYQDIATLNHLSAPYTLHIGEQLILVQSQKTAPAGLGNPPVIISHLPGHHSASTVSNPTRKATTATPATTTTVSTWVWPTQGKVVHAFSANTGGLNKGIDIAGKQGQPIKSAASGEVVYSGNGIPGYGNLIIIKHNADYLTAYAYNQQNLVHEGQHVNAGQIIARMGHVNSQPPALHFEMRYDGQPVDPLRYLPRQ